jgi:hypothetical protein
LEESDQKEKEWFDKNIYECIFREQIIMNTSISNLLKSMDNLYNHFIKTDWIPRMINEMRTKEDMIKKELKRLEPVITKENFPEFLSLCLDYKRAFPQPNSCGVVQIEQVPTKYFIGASPVMPYTFFKSVVLYIPFDYNTNLGFNIIGYMYKDCNIRKLGLFFGKEYNDHNFNYNTTVYDSIQIFENVFSNFYDKIKINHVLEDNIFNIPIVRFININTKFEKLLMKYIKHRLNKNVLKSIKRTIIDFILMSVKDNYSTEYINSYAMNVVPLFNNIFMSMMGHVNKDINDFILQNLTIDFFVESEEDILKLESELKIIQSNIVSFRNI